MILVWQIAEDSENCQTSPRLHQTFPLYGIVHAVVELTCILRWLQWQWWLWPVQQCQLQSATIVTVSNDALRYYSPAYSIIQDVTVLHMYYCITIHNKNGRFNNFSTMALLLKVSIWNTATKVCLSPFNTSICA